MVRWRGLFSRVFVGEGEDKEIKASANEQIACKKTKVWDI